MLLLRVWNKGPDSFQDMQPPNLRHSGRIFSNKPELENRSNLLSSLGIKHYAASATLQCRDLAAEKTNPHKKKHVRILETKKDSLEIFNSRRKQ
jgi:hypothetical protein